MISEDTSMWGGNKKWLANFLAPSSVQAAQLFVSEVRAVLIDTLAAAPGGPATLPRDLRAQARDPWVIQPCPYRSSCETLEKRHGEP